MTIEKVKHDLISAVVAYGVALLALLLWPDRQAAYPDTVLFVGWLILIAVGLSVDWVAFKWRPSRPSRPKFDLLAFVTQTGPRAPKSRRRRFAIPYFLGFFVAYTFSYSLRYSAPPDWGVTAFVVSAPLVLGGWLASNAWWALAARPGSSATPPL
jgi:hypothetical protein